MKTLHFTIIIKARPEDVWNTMLNPDTYRVWTAEFAAGSYFEGTWAAGERTRFARKQRFLYSLFRPGRVASPGGQQRPRPGKSGILDGGVQRDVGQLLHGAAVPDSKLGDAVGYRQAGRGAVA